MIRSTPSARILRERPVLRRGLAILALLASVLPALPGRAGEDTLGGFEDEIERREDDSGSSSSGGDAVDFGALDSALSSDLSPDERRPGDPATAIVRLESTYQHLAHSDVDGLATRAELVAGFIGIGGEFVRYWEDSPEHHLDFGAIEGLVRFAPKSWFQITFAAGSRHIAGRHSRWAHGGGLGIGLHPQEWLGFEADARWAKVSDRTMGDYRLGVLLRVPKLRYLALRGGYRVIQYQNETLDGPELGLVGTW